MIDLYTWATPNGRKVSIALEELGLPYRVHAVNIVKGEQLGEAFSRINPNQKIPVITDSETGLTLIESGAILMYLAGKAGRLLPTEPEGYWDTIQWLMWQKAAFGPMLGQAVHYLKYNRGKSTYSEDRFEAEAQRLYRVLEARLEKTGFIAAGEYTIADIACWPWAARHEYQQVDLHDYPNVLDWYLRIAARPAVRAGWAVPVDEELPLPCAAGD